MAIKVSTEDFIKKAQRVHGERYNYSQTSYTKSMAKVIISCRIHGNFEQRAGIHLQGTGCQKCGLETRHNLYVLSQKEFISKVKTKHGDKFDYSLLVYTGMHSPIKLICKKHQLIIEKNAQAFLLQSNGCSQCLSETRSQQHLSNTDDFINKAKRIWSSLYDYSLVDYKDEKTLITLQCKVHGLFSVKPNRHLYSLQGCNMCNNSSKGENIIETFLKEKNIVYKPQKTFELCINPKTKRKLRFDFYLIDYNLCIEFDGLFHYKGWKNDLKSLQEIKRKDRIKNRFCKNNSIDLLRIPYWNVNQLDKILTSKLLTQ